jgi:mannose-6-phosphate isomerase-like protein (cupin superfamily)
MFHGTYLRGRSDLLCAVQLFLSEADMRKFDNTTADTNLIGDVAVARWEQYGLGDLMPFDAMWYVVPPGSSTPVHHHPEPELSIVVSGSGVLQAGDDSAAVRPGTAFLLESEEDHTVSNHSTDQPLVVFSAYWMPRENVAAALAGQAAHA